jgi:hypothetical protein
MDIWQAENNLDDNEGPAPVAEADIETGFVWGPDVEYPGEAPVIGEVVAPDDVAPRDSRTDETPSIEVPQRGDEFDSDWDGEANIVILDGWSADDAVFATIMIFGDLPDVLLRYEPIEEFDGTFRYIISRTSAVQLIADMYGRAGFSHWLIDFGAEHAIVEYTPW